MNERELRNLIADVKGGRLSRRAFVQRMIAVGLTGADGRHDAEPNPGWRWRGGRNPLQADQGRRRRRR